MHEQGGPFAKALQRLEQSCLQSTGVTIDRVRKEVRTSKPQAGQAAVSFCRSRNGSEADDLRARFTARPSMWRARQLARIQHTVRAQLHSTAS